jgi:hypothetical protein
VWDALREGAPSTWLRASREAIARRTLHAETAHLEPTDAARAFVVNQGPGPSQDYAAAFLAHIEDGAPEPTVPVGLRWRAAQVRALLAELTPRHRHRL